MKKNLRFIALGIFLAVIYTAPAQTSQVQFKVVYNAASGLYEAHAIVVGASLTYPSTIPYPSKFTVVVPASISNAPFTVVQSVNPPGMSWAQNNSIYAPAAAPASDFHAFTIPGGGGNNAYPSFTVGTDMLLFKFSVPHTACDDGIRCYINGTDPNSAQPGMAGIDFTQAFKTYQAGVPSGGNRYQSNTGSPVVLPKPVATTGNSFACGGGTLYLTATGTTSLGNNALSYTWNGTGGFSTTTQNPAVSPYSAPGTYTVTVKDINACTVTSAVVLTAPYEVLQAAVSATNGAATVAATGGTPVYSYLWNNGQATATITGLTAGTYLVTVTDSKGCSASGSVEVTPPAIASIYGHVLYNDVTDGGINGVTITLKDASEAILGTTVTTSHPVSGLPGYYAFSNIPSGNGYKLNGDFYGQWGGNNATDDLIVKLNTVGSYPLTGLQAVVADVNATGSISGLDALYIMLRTIGSINAYPAGDWEVSEETINFSGIPLVENLTALCQGDVNGSYTPGGSKSGTDMPLADGGTMSVAVGEPFEYEIRGDMDAGVGAMTLFLGYDQDKFDVSGVTGVSEGVKYTIGNGRIAVAWADTKTLELKAGDLILRVMMSVKEKISVPSNIFNIREGSEFADRYARPYDNFGLKMAKISTTPEGMTDLALFNYPNPFTVETTISYTIPADGRVKITLTDLSGAGSQTIIDMIETAGSHKVSLNAAELNLSTGVYLYRIDYDNASASYNKCGKMIFTR